MRVQELFDLKGKVALVTGGGRGIGKFISRGLAEAGADVIVGSRKVQNCQEVAEELKKLGVRTLAVECDMGKAEEIEKFVRAAMQAFGRIDILVNNAGITWGAPTLEYPLDKWDKIMAVNVRGPFLLSQQVAKIMISQGGGKIINVASFVGLKAGPDGLPPAIAYNTSKGGLITMTKELAVRLAQFNIQVNAILPGMFGTDMMAWMETDAFKSAKEEFLRKVPLRKVGGEEDIKGLAVFLASAASNYMTGGIIPIDGGLLAA
jgi:NAD(P)-dependent dehydrogenase (short-subunit alcohol dehydrogenase family)